MLHEEEEIDKFRFQNGDKMFLIESVDELKHLNLVKDNNDEELEEEADIFDKDREKIDDPKLEALCDEFAEIFQDEIPAGKPTSRNVEHHIPLIDGASPTQAYQYRISPQHRDAIQETVEELLKAGHIEHSKSQWRSPLLVVMRKDGKIRVVIDLRKVNGLTKGQAYTMKNQDELLETLAGHQVFSLIDLRNGYHNIPMADKDKEKTAFSVPGPKGGQYHFTVMPFGLKGAPATFQQFMDDIFRPFIDRFMVVYIDDIAIYSDSLEDHYKHLRSVFQVMKDKQLYANRKKCFFRQKRIPYLGHYVSEGGIKMDPKKVEAVRNWPPITNIKQLRGFLGLSGFYRKFIKNYSGIALPLTKLLKDDTKFHWTSDQDKARDYLIDALTTAPILTTPQKGLPLEVATDASDESYGAVLSCGGKPVAFMSRKFSDSQKNWKIYQKEYFAIFAAFMKWDYRLRTKEPITVITDNAAISRIMNQPKLSAMQARWISYLSEFNIHPQFIEGKENKVADALSRRDLLGISWVDTSNWKDQIREATKRLPLPKGMTERDGLYYKNDLLYIPAYGDIKTLIIQENHDGQSGHMGYKKTLSKINTTYYWEKIAKDVERFIKTCDICQRVKSSTQKPYGTLNPISPPASKFETYSLDFIGPLPRTKSGYDGILVIVDMFSKLVSIIPIEFSYGAKDVAEIVYQRIVTRFGFIKKIITDRDPRFTGAFWKQLFKLHGTKLALSTAYHPQSDGQTERTNRTLEQVIRTQINGKGDNWDTLLPMAEFAINTTVNVSTGFSPFQLTYGIDPKSPIDLDIGVSTTPAAEDFVKQMKANLDRARSNILKAQLGQKAQADKHRRDHSFQVGDKVMLSTRNLHFSSSSRKLLPKWVGPYLITDQIHGDSFKLDLRGNFQIHPVFHVSLLKPYSESDPTIFPNRIQEPPSPVLIDDHEEYTVKKILKARKSGRSWQYLIEWEGFPIEDATWEPEENLSNAQDLLKEFKDSVKLNLNILTVNQDTECPRRNSFKKGDGRQGNFNTETHQQAKMENNTEEILMSYELEGKIIEKIRGFKLSRFISVPDQMQNEVLGYHQYDTEKIYYFIPGVMMLFDVHSETCRCARCKTVIDWNDSIEEVVLTHVPLNKQPMTRKPILLPRPANRTYAMDSPQIGRRSGTKTHPEWVQQVQKVISKIGRFYSRAQATTEFRNIQSRLFRKEPRVYTIFPTAPKQNWKKSINQITRDIRQLLKVEQILDQIRQGKQRKGSAHQEYVFYKERCEHGIKFYHAETECRECDQIEIRLNAEGYMVV